MRNFSILTGRWTGIFSLIWYADILHESDEVPYRTFNAFSRRGALRKAKRYINRILAPLEERQAFVYAYDENKFTLEKVNV